MYIFDFLNKFVNLKMNNKEKIINLKNAVISYAPNGEAFPLPIADDYLKEFQKIRHIAKFLMMRQ